MKRGHAIQVANAVASLFIDAAVARELELAAELRVIRGHVRDELAAFHRNHDRSKAGAS
jgi:hypothetical protein